MMSMDPASRIKCCQAVLAAQESAGTQDADLRLGKAMAAKTETLPALKRPTFYLQEEREEIDK